MTDSQVLTAERITSGFAPSYFSILEELEAKHFWFRARNRIIVWALQKFFPNARNFVEIGCGTGFILSAIAKAFPKLELSGTEVFSEALDFPRSRVPRANFFELDLLKMDISEKFDVIGSFDVLEHIQEDEEALRRIATALRPGGGLIVTVPQHQFLWSQSDESAQHVRRYERAELVQKVADAGLKVVYVSSFVSLLLPAMLLSRRLNRVKSSEHNLLKELQIGGATGFICERILNVERWLIKRGVNFPVGGSLLLVARKV